MPAGKGTRICPAMRGYTPVVPPRPLPASPAAGRGSPGTLRGAFTNTRPLHTTGRKSCDTPELPCLTPCHPPPGGGAPVIRSPPGRETPVLLPKLPRLPVMPPETTASDTRDIT